MARDVRAAYDKAALAGNAKAVIPVGESWTRAIQTGVADANPYDGIEGASWISGPTTNITPAPTATTAKRW